MGKIAELNVDGNIKKSNELTLEDLIWLYKDFERIH